MPCETPLKVLTRAEGAHRCHLVRFPDEVRRDMPLPASGVAAVGHKIAESTVGIGTRLHGGVKRCSQLRVVQRHHSGERGLRTGTHAQASMGTCNVHLIRCLGVCLLSVWALEVFVAWQGPRPDRARQSPCESKHFVVGKQWCIEVGEHRRQGSAARTCSFSVVC